jgi:DNA-binding winged helix-turn-helix (wHTH) protein
MGRAESEWVELNLTLLRGGNPCPSMPKAFDILLVLVQNRDRIVEKEELMNSCGRTRYHLTPTVS